MANLDLLEKSIPVAPIKIAALKGCEELGKTVNDYLVQFRKELMEHRTNGIAWSGYAEESFLIDCDCPRFGTGEAKGVINESIRGVDLFILCDITNYSITYKVNGYENHMSPDDHFQDLKRIIAAATGKAHRINVVMPFLYEGRQHKRSKRESLDCAMALQELVSMGVSNIITFDAHDPRVQNAIPLSGFDNFINRAIMSTILGGISLVSLGIVTYLSYSQGGVMHGGYGKVITLSHLPGHSLDISGEYPNLYWPFGQRILSGAKLIAHLIKWSWNS